MNTFEKETTKILREIGLSEKEITVYICALGLDSFTIGSISLLTKIKRPTCYVLVESLSKKGLISSVPSVKKQRYRAESPDALSNSMRMKADMLGTLSKEVESMRSKTISSKVKFFNNKMGLESIYKDILIQKPKVVETYFNPEMLSNIMGSNWADVWSKLRIERGINVINYSPKGKANMPGFNANKKSMRVVYELPAGFDPKIAITVYGDSVGFLCDSKELMSFSIKSKEFASTVRGLFGALKLISKKK